MDQRSSSESSCGSCSSGESTPGLRNHPLRVENELDLAQLSPPDTPGRFEPPAGRPSGCDIIIRTPQFRNLFDDELHLDDITEQEFLSQMSFSPFEPLAPHTSGRYLEEREESQSDEEDSDSSDEYVDHRSLGDILASLESALNIGLDDNVQGAMPEEQEEEEDDDDDDAWLDDPPGMRCEFSRQETGNPEDILGALKDILRLSKDFQFIEPASRPSSKRPRFKVSNKLLAMRRMFLDRRARKKRAKRGKSNKKPQFRVGEQAIVAVRSATLFGEATRSSGYCLLCEKFYRDIESDRIRHTKDRSIETYEFVPLLGKRVLMPLGDESNVLHCAVCRIFCFRKRFKYHKCAEYLHERALLVRGRGDFYCVMCQILFEHRQWLFVHWCSEHDANENYAIENVRGLKTLVPCNTDLEQTLQFCCDFCQVFTCKNRPEVKCRTAHPVPARDFLTIGD